MKKQIKTNVMGIFIFLSTFISSSCEREDSQLDFSNSWIEFYKYDNELDSSGKLLNRDTITVSMNDNFIIRIKTQSNNGSLPLILKQIDNHTLLDITDIPGEANLESNYEEERGYRQINKINIELNEAVFSSGQTIKYKTSIGSLDGEIQKELNIIIE